MKIEKVNKVLFLEETPPEQTGIRMDLHTLAIKLNEIADKVNQVIDTVNQLTESR